MAWLGTAPDPPDIKGNVKRPDPIPRIKALEKAGEAPLIPPNPAPYITDWLFEIGPTSPTAFGEGPLAIRHIAADLAAFGIEVEPWEARLLRRLSREHAEEAYLAKQPDRPQPYAGSAKDLDDRRAMVDRKVGVALAGMTKKPKQE